jgi:SAM-dependent methyltransferase
MKNPEDIRKIVSRAYASAVTRESESCCGSGKRAYYDSDDLEGLPEGMTDSSFGCGNPLNFSGVKEGEVVLDLGSGAGMDLLIAARKVGPGGRVIGVDMTDEMILKAREMIDRAGVANTEVRKGLIEDLPVDTASVDWVISNCVINLSPEKGKVFAEIARVLKPGGRMQVTDLVAKGLPRAVRGDLDLYCSCISGAISEEDYIAGLEAAGLVDIEVRERLGYEVPELEAVIESDRITADSCCKSRSVRELAEQCDGKVWSAKIFARKPE